MRDLNRGLRGDFFLKVRNTRTGEIQSFEEKNLIVTQGKYNLAHLLGGNVTNRPVTQIGFGTDGTAPAAGDTALTGAFTKALGAVSYPTANSVQWAWTLATSEGNGLAIQEFGLLCTNGDLFSRRVRDVINKTSELEFEGTWTISF